MALNDPFQVNLLIYASLIVISVVLALKFSLYKISIASLIIANLFNITTFFFLIFIIKRFPGISLEETFLDLSLLFSFAMVLSWIQKRTLKLLFAFSIFSLFSLLFFVFSLKEGSLFGPTPEVLRNNFWIILHVFSIIIGYCLIFTASAISHFYILKKLIFVNKFIITTKIENVIIKLTKYSTVFIIAGTVIGSCWAKIAWGRFWDWDPKETSVLIVIIILLIGLIGQHLIKKSLLLNLYFPIFAFIMVVYTWIGVNIFHEGIHSYGFSDKGFFLLLSFTFFESIFFLLHFILKLFATPK